MKRTFSQCLFLVLTLSLMMSGCKSKNGNNTQNQKKGEEIPASVIEKYNEDAHRLTMRELMTSTKPTSELGGEIPQDRVQYYMTALKKCYMMMKFDAEVPDMSHIHTFPDPNMQELRVLLTKDSPFIEPFSQKRTTTRDMYLNQILSKNGFTVKEYTESSIGPMVIFSTKKYVNTQEVAHILTQIEGIDTGEIIQPMGDGNNITSGAEGKNGFGIRFSVGKGDCPSGCIHRKYWMFDVAADGTITYMGTRGSLPDDEGTEEED